MAGYYGYLCKDLNRTIPANSYDDCNSFAKRLARKCAALRRGPKGRPS